MDFQILAIVVVMVVVTFVYRAVKVVPQQSAWVVERLGKFRAVLPPGPNILIPFVDNVAYRHSLKEIPLDVPSQVCITRDNTQLQVDGILYFQVTDAMRASYGSSNYVLAITQLCQTTLRSVIGKMELDRTFEERDMINGLVVNALDDAASSSALTTMPLIRSRSSKVLSSSILPMTLRSVVWHSCVIAST